MYPVPAQPKIYHILHVDRLASVIAAGGLFCDGEMQRRGSGGTTIGMNKIKEDRLYKRRVKCHPDDFVGDYVPFYFCPRSVMLYMIHMANDPDLAYKGGQQPIVHLEADLYRTVSWLRITASVGLSPSQMQLRPILSSAQTLISLTKLTGQLFLQRIGSPRT